VHSSELDIDDIHLLRKANVQHITVGVENCSERVLKSINKPQSLNKIDSLFRACIKHGIQPYCLIILFLPETTLEDLIINIEQLTAWQKIGVQVSIEPFCMPYKNAPLWESLYEFEHSYQNGLKHADLINPANGEARKCMEIFRERLPKKIAELDQRTGHAHKFKGVTGKLMIELLQDIIQNEFGYCINQARAL
jgi:radical SAM superfamily enzyme YgiQ (UPF0313 family)